ncbi:MAG: glycosyl hydrolase family 28-related protein [Candidatus Saccharimonadaceae bacterium]
MAGTRLPVPGSDRDVWGTLLNDFLSVEHTSDGTLKDGTVSNAKIADNAITSAKITDNAITSTKIANNAVTNAHIASGIPLSKLATDPLARANHTGTQDAATITSGVLNAARIPDLSTSYAKNDPKTLNVKVFGAVGNDTADDTVAIQTALNACDEGGTVLFPVGQYRISAPLSVPPYVRLQGSYGMRGQSTLTSIASRIKPLASFTGAAAIVLLDKEQGSYSKDNEGIIIKDLTLDGSALGATLASGIKATGLVHGVQLVNLNISYFTDRGLFTTSFTRADTTIQIPYSWYMENIQVWATGSDGFRLASLTDSIVNNCRAIGTGRHGFYINGMANSTFTNCRAEWSTQHGFWLQGSWGTGQGSGGTIFTNTTTDRNKFDGIRVESTGSAAILFNGLMLRRDGRNGGTGGGGYTAMRVINATTPIHISDLIVYPGVDDDGTSTNSPEIGFTASGSLYTNVVSGFIHAATTAWLDGGLNTNLIRGNSITERVGTTTTYTTTVPAVPTGGGSSSSTVVTRKPNIPPYRGQPSYVQNFATGHGWTATGFGGTTNINQTTAGSRAGSQQVSLVTDAAGGLGLFSKTGAPAQNFNAKANQVTIWLKTVNQQQLGTLSLQVSDAGGFAANRFAEWQLCINGVTTLLGSNQEAITYNNILTPIQLSTGDLIKTGTPDMSAITEWRIALADRNNGQGAQTVAINSIEVTPNGIARLGTNGVLCLTFDDAYAGAAVYGRQVLGAFGFQGTFFPIVDVLGTSGTFMTATQLKQLAVDGHEIGVHSYTKANHDNYNTLTATEAEDDTRLAAQWLADNGLSGETMAYPQGSFYPFDAGTQKVYAAARTTLGTLQHTPTPILNPWRMRSISKVGGVGGYATTNLTQSGGVLEQAVAANSLVTLTFHNITQGAATAALECSMADLTAICQKAKDLGMAVTTLGQAIRAQY